MGELGRRTPTDWKHVEKYPFSAVLPSTLDFTVSRVISLPWWHKRHDQLSEGSCVGHGITMERAIANTRQNVLAGAPIPRSRRYNPIRIWNEAKKIDEWEDTLPGDSNGTSVRAGYDVVRGEGCQRVKSITINGDRIVVNTGTYLPDLNEGIITNRWATTVDEMRWAIKNAIPMAIGVTWYSNFDSPVYDSTGQPWIGRGNLGGIRGGHCLAVFGASDSKQAFKLKNSWGETYPQVWIPYETMQTLIDDYGEVALVTDA